MNLSPELTKKQASKELPAPSRMWLAMSFLLPTLVAFGPFLSLKPGSEGQPYAFRVALVILVLAAPALYKQVITERTVQFKAFMALSILWLLWTPVTMAWSPAPDRGFRLVVGSCITVLGALTIAILLSSHRRYLVRFAQGWIFSLIPMFAVNAWEYRTGKHFVETFTGTYWKWGNTLGGVFHNPNIFSTYLVLSACFLAWRLFTPDTRFKPVLLVLLGTVGFVASLTTSRTGVLGTTVVVGLFIFGFLNYQKRKEGGVAILIVLMFLFAIFLYVSGLGEDIVSKLFSPFSADKEASDSFRLISLTFAWSVLGSFTGIIGVGANGFLYAFDKWSINALGYSAGADAHNIFSEVGVDFGWVLLIPLLIAFYQCTIQAIRLLKHQQPNESLDAILALAVIFSLVAAANAVGSVAPLTIWWAAFGFAIAVLDTRARSSQNSKNRSASAVRGSVARV